MKPKQIINLTESEVRHIVRESIKVVLEGASKKLFHYCGIEQLKKMLKTNKLFFFSGNDKAYNGGYYGFSTTRQRNSKMGFPAMSRRYGGGLTNTLYNSFLVRLELDGETVQNLQYDYRNKHYGVKVKPFDYFWHDNDEWGDESERVNGKEWEMKNVQNDPYDADAREQHYSQAEDRILSKKKFVDGFRKCLTRIDVYVDLDCLEYDCDKPEFNAVIEALSVTQYIKQKMNIPVCYYINQDAFNIQANKTIDYETLLNEIYKIEKSM